MHPMNPVQMAEALVRASDDCVIVIEVSNGGSSSRWQQAFPSLPPEVAADLERTTFLRFGSHAEAVEAFQRLTADCAEHGGRGVLVGSIDLCTRPFDSDDGNETVSWDLDDGDRPVWKDLRWTREPIPERI